MAAWSAMSGVWNRQPIPSAAMSGYISCVTILDILSNMIMRPHPMVIKTQPPHMIGRYDPVRATSIPESTDCMALLRE
ncbi:hypothetical protein OG21DRAFT_1503029 [Imleria badia]|nr:hypothetical protein OG21DRAFT_1503029 [Imleria badia]